MRRSRRSGCQPSPSSSTEGAAPRPRETVLATYAIGDVQGCYRALRALLDAIAFDPAADRLWLAGDLVNRGPRSLEVLRFVAGLGPAAESVLGNHDLHLLALAHGARPARPKDTLDAVLAAPDRSRLLDWLSERPALLRDRRLGFTLVHAGLPPEWSVDEAAERAHELECTLRSAAAPAFLAAMYGDAPRRWDAALAGHERLRYITNAFTRIRFCAADGALDLDASGPPGTQPAGYVPWYAHPGRRSRGERVVFGHWSALDLEPAEARRLNAFHVDTGCVWGRRLTALELETLTETSVACPDRE